MDIGASIDRARCTQWVGETYLETLAPTTASGIGRSEFLNAWKDLLPESWRNDVAFSKLTVSGAPASLVTRCIDHLFFLDVTVSDIIRRKTHTSTQIPRRSASFIVMTARK